MTRELGPRVAADYPGDQLAAFTILDVLAITPLHVVQHMGLAGEKLSLEEAVQ